MGDDSEPKAFASPACSLGEVDPGYAGLPLSRAEVMAWRRETRARLIAERRARDPALRRGDDARIAAGLDAAIGVVEGRTVSLYWPFRAEPDLRAWGAGAIARGARLALPAVVERGRPLVFRAWTPGDRLVPGIWNIPVPEQDLRVVPDVVIAPVVGFDAAGYRLGYGGGYYDRTLAALPPGWHAFGVGYALAALPTIHPLPHDVPLDAIVTPEGTVPGRARR
jgi:5,10-methenyltetrahydrofolate synthetase